MNKHLAMLLSLVLVATIAFPAFAAEEAKKEEIKYGSNIGDTFKPFELSDPVGGKKVAMEKMMEKGKDLVLFFMNTTCSLCRAQEKKFVEGWTAIEKKVNLYAVSVDFDASRVVALAKAENLPFPVLHDEDATLLQASGFSGTPVVIVIDDSGKVKQKISGYRSAEMNDFIKKLSR